MSKDIVVMIDMQKDFIDGALGSPAAQAIVPKVVEYLNSLPADVPVFATLDTHRDDYLDTLEGKMLPVKHCIHSTLGWEFNGDVAKALSKRIENNCTVEQVMKFTFGSRELPIGLKAWLADAKEQTCSYVLHLLGLCTDICCVCNAMILRTAFPNNRIVCHADMCAGTSPEAHKAALTVMKSCQIEIVGE